MGTRTIYPSAASYIPKNHPLTREYLDKMPRTFNNIVGYDPPAKQTQHFIDECQQDCKRYYKGWDAFRLLPYWQTLYHTNDGAHLVVNLIKLMWGMLLNHDKYEYTLEQHLVEIDDAKRFHNLSLLEEKKVVGLKKLPWVLSKADKDRIVILSKTLIFMDLDYPIL